MYEMQIKFIKFPQKFISHAMFCPSAGCQRLSPVDFNPGTNSLAKLPKRKFIFQAPIFRCELLGLGNVYTCNLPYTTIYNLQSISWWKKHLKQSLKSVDEKHVVCFHWQIARIPWILWCPHNQPLTLTVDHLNATHTTVDSLSTNLISRPFCFIDIVGCNHPHHVKTSSASQVFSKCCWP